MAVTPTGPLGEPLKRVRDMLAACSAWQTWTGEDQTGALARVFLCVVDESDEVFPLAIVDYGNHHAGKTSDGVNFPTTHGIYIAFHDDLGTELSDEDAITTFQNNFGPTWLEFLGQARAQGVPLLDFSLINGPIATRLEDAPSEGGVRRVWAEYAITLGVR